jgi:excisionase family DNA binding protein
MRWKFDTKPTYYGQLRCVSKRPIDNHDSRISLLRLQFLIFQKNSATRLETKGKIASRDFILWTEMEGDSGIQRLADALRVRPALSVQAWLDAKGRQPWMAIRFGQPSPADQRQPFDDIRGFDPDAEGLEIRYVYYEKSGGWATVEEAASDLNVSTSKVRRLVDFHKEEFGEALVSLTVGRHRRINLTLLRLLGPN